MILKRRIEEKLHYVEAKQSNKPQMPIILMRELLYLMKALAQNLRFLHMPKSNSSMQITAS